MQPFADPTTVARYVEDTPRRVPGFAALHRMAMLLLRESAPDTGNILVLGAGGGLELKAFVEAQPYWRFVGVDPSAAMLDLARRILGPNETRVEFREGYIDGAPLGPFDGATCLLMLHFLGRDERLRTLQGIRRRLKPSARLIVAHHSGLRTGELELWLARSIAFASESAVNYAEVAASAAAMAERLQILSPDEDEALLREAGFYDVDLFYAGFSFRGWVATA